MERCPNCKHLSLRFDDLDLLWVCENCDCCYDSEELERLSPEYSG